MHVHSLRHLYPLELSLSPDIKGESGIDSLPALSSGTSVNAACSDTSSGGEAMVWLCPICNAPHGDMDMIGCDLCDKWFHFGCVRMGRPPLAEVVLF